MKQIVIYSEKFGCKTVLIDDADYDMVSRYKWSVVKRARTFYAASSKWKGSSIYMHRLIMNCHIGDVVDHRDHDGLNNQKSNLRKCSKAQNNANLCSRLNSSSKYLGVSWFKSDQKWHAQICKDGKKYRLGHFDSEVIAAQAYNAAAKALHGEFANINII